MADSDFGGGGGVCVWGGGGDPAYVAFARGDDECCPLPPATRSPSGALAADLFAKGALGPVLSP